MSFRKPILKPSGSNHAELIERRLTELESKLRRVAVRHAQAAASNTLTMIFKATHGLAVKDVVRHDGSNWTKAQADTTAHAVVGGIVVAVLSPDVFVIATSGRVVGLSGLTAGSVYYLSAATAGALTTTAPSFSVPVLLADSTTSGVLINGGNPLTTELPLLGELKQTYTASDTFTVPSTVDTFYAVLIASGGNGGASASAAMNYYVASTSGGAVNIRLSGRAMGGGGGGGACLVLEFDAIKMRAASVTTFGFSISAGIVGAFSSGNLVQVHPGLAGSNAAVSTTDFTPGEGGRGGFVEFTTNLPTYIRSFLPLMGQHGTNGPFGIQFPSTPVPGGEPLFGDSRVTTGTSGGTYTGYGFGGKSDTSAAGAAVLIYHR